MGPPWKFLGFQLWALGSRGSTLGTLGSHEPTLNTLGFQLVLCCELQPTETEFCNEPRMLHKKNFG